MISYREKELLMVMKMLQDETEKNISNIQNVMDSVNKRENIKTEKLELNIEKIEEYDQLVEMARDKGYDLYMRAEDILSQEEIQDLIKRKESIEQEFKQKVKLKGADYGFLFSAVALQIAKQIFLTIDIETGDKKAKETEKEYKEKYDNKNKIDGKQKAKRYYAPTQQILNTKTVPYDIVQNTKTFNMGDKETNLGLNGSNHRFRSVGHDPLLGLVIGTANILTNTATFYSGNHSMQSYHIGYVDEYMYREPYIKSLASTGLMMEKVWERHKEDPKILKKAFIKEIDHIDSDKGSVAGIPLPFLSLIFGDEKARKLAEDGFDLQTFDKIVDVGKQAGVSILINLIISWLHKLYIVWDEVKDSDGVLEKAKTYYTTKINDFDKVRTKKIIMYSNIIASTVNLGVCVGGGALACYLDDPGLAKKLFSHTDVGGFMVTIATVFKDTKFILKVKDDFIKASINKDFDEKLQRIQQELDLSFIEK